MIKFLYLDKIFFALVALVLVLLDTAFFILINIFSFIWNFKLMSWQQLDEDNHDYCDDMMGDKKVVSKNPVDEFKNIYNSFRGIRK